MLLLLIPLWFNTIIIDGSVRYHKNDDTTGYISISEVYELSTIIMIILVIYDHIFWYQIPMDCRWLYDMFSIYLYI